MGTSVLVVDDDAAFRRLAARILTAAGFVVVGEVATVGDARSAASALRPDAALVDVTLADGDGIVLAGELTALPWRPHVVLTSIDPAAATPTEVSRSHVRAFVPKSELPRAPLAQLLSRD